MLKNLFLVSVHLQERFQIFLRWHDASDSVVEFFEWSRIFQNLLIDVEEENQPA